MQIVKYLVTTKQLRGLTRTRKRKAFLFMIKMMGGVDGAGKKTEDATQKQRDGTSRKVLEDFVRCFYVRNLRGYVKLWWADLRKRSTMRMRHRRQHFHLLELLYARKSAQPFESSLIRRSSLSFAFADLSACSLFLFAFWVTMLSRRPECVLGGGYQP